MSRPQMPSAKDAVPSLDDCFNGEPHGRVFFQILVQNIGRNAIRDLVGVAGANIFADLVRHTGPGGEGMKVRILYWEFERK